MIQIPLPRENFDGDIVVASVWIDDDEGTALVLTLAPEPPYYRVREIRWSHDSWRTTSWDAHENIVPAVRQYEDSGGDW